MDGALLYLLDTGSEKLFNVLQAELDHGGSL